MSNPSPFLTVSIESEDLAAAGVNLAELEVEALDGTEQISQLFHYTAKVAYHVQEPIARETWMFAQVTLLFWRGDEVVRRVHGMVCGVRDRMTHAELRKALEYELTVVPRMWRLGQRQRSAVYLDQTVTEIIRGKLGDGLELVEGTDFSFSLLEEQIYPQRDFVLQYQETDLQFVQRLAERWGIAYHFQHTGGVDRVVFTDHADGFDEIEGDATVTFRPRGDKTDVYELCQAHQTMPSLFRSVEYDYENPQLDLDCTLDLSNGETLDESGDGGELVEFGGGFRSRDEGDHLNRVREQEQRSARVVFSGTADVATLAAGGTFELTGHSREVPKLLVTKITVRAVLTPAQHEKRTALSVEFDAIDAGLTFRPPRDTPVPRVFGILPAVVEFAEATDDKLIDEFPDLDDHGRYKIRLKLDLDGVGSHRVRLARPVAGLSEGWHFPIRKGVEVAVAFQGGDPDRPVIVGALYHHATHDPVVQSNQTKNRLITESGVMIEIDDGAGSTPAPTAG